MATCMEPENVAEHPPATSKEGEELWKRKYQVLKRKCREFEQVNEILFVKAKRIHQMIERAEAEKRFLIKRLDQFEVVEFPKVTTLKSEVKRERTIPPPPPALLGPFPQTHSAPSTPGTGDDRSPDAPLTIVTNENIPESVPPTQSKPPPLQPSAPSKSKGKSSANIPKAKPKTKTNAASSSTKTSAAVKPPAKQRKTAQTATNEKQKGDSNSKKSTVSKRKKNVDPNAPKKPSNSFFWFCQEHRPGLQEQFRGEGVTGQHDLTKVLAKMWSEITPEEKKKYYGLYAEDKKRYDREFQEYTAKQQLKAVTETPVPP